MSLLTGAIDAISEAVSRAAVTIPALEMSGDNDLDALRATVQALREGYEILTGQRGDPLDTVVTHRDFVEGRLKLDVTQGFSSVGGVGIVLPGGGTIPSIPETIEDDYTTPPKLVNVEATAALTTILLTWDDPHYTNWGVVEVWRAATDDLGAAIRIGTTTANIYLDPVGSTGTGFYYWARIVSRMDVEGPFQGVGGAYAKTGVVGSSDLADEIITAQKLAAGAVDALDKFGVGLEPVYNVDALPDPAGYAGPKLVLLSADGKLYRYVAGAWTRAVAAADLQGQVSDTQIAAGAVTADAIQAGAVEADKLAAGAVTADAIQAGAVVAGKLAAAAIVAGDGVIANAAIGAAQIGSVSADTITSGFLAAARILAGSLSADKIAANSITTAQIKAGSVHGDRIQAGTIAAAQIAAGGVTADRISAASLAAISAVLGVVSAGDVSGSTFRVGAFTSEWVWPAYGAGGGVLIHPNGILIGNANGGPGSNGYAYINADGSGYMSNVTVGRSISADSLKVDAANIVSTLHLQGQAVTFPNFNRYADSVLDGVPPDPAPGDSGW